jgi:transglutaminase-like putative cysteine protease
MFYAIRHFTRYRYSKPVSQSSMEVRMHPRSEYSQRCFTFQLSVSPRARVFSYHDHTGNVIHHFDIPEPHRQLTIIADALVDVETPPDLPDTLEKDSWRQLDEMIERDDYWDMLMPSRFVRNSPELDEFARKLGVNKRNGGDPLSVLRGLNSKIFEEFEYTKNSTKVDSPIEVALKNKKGVCQDFAHIMISLVRGIHVPCRYVSGYVHHDKTYPDRSVDGATHAWVEALLPGLGWVGFDPTNNLLAGRRHIRTAIGRDYADVPPTIGTLKGSANSEMQVRVRVTPSEAVLPVDQEFAADEEWSKFLANDQKPDKTLTQQQQ